MDGKRGRPTPRNDAGARGSDVPLGDRMRWNDLHRAVQLVGAEPAVDPRRQRPAARRTVRARECFIETASSAHTRLIVAARQRAVVFGELMEGPSAAGALVVHAVLMSSLLVNVARAVPALKRDATLLITGINSPGSCNFAITSRYRAGGPRGRAGRAPISAPAGNATSRSPSPKGTSQTSRPNPRVRPASPVFVP
jgi:hypothetical protein